jgi:hypothetical protein
MAIWYIDDPYIEDDFIVSPEIQEYLDDGFVLPEIPFTITNNQSVNDWGYIQDPIAYKQTVGSPYSIIHVKPTSSWSKTLPNELLQNSKIIFTNNINTNYKKYQNCIDLADQLQETIDENGYASVIDNSAPTTVNHFVPNYIHIIHDCDGTN